MGLALQQTPRITREEYDRMVARGLLDRQRVELIHGAILPMAPIGPPHRNVVVLLTYILLPKLLGRAWVQAQAPFLAFDDSEPEPDIAVVPLANYAKEHPSRAFLLIEVADSSLAFDRETKAPLYAASNVDEYWIVDVVARAVEIYAAPADGRFTDVRRVEMGGTLMVAAFPDVEFPVAALFPE
jgi:Uma2 family endonuclease